MPPLYCTVVFITEMRRAVHSCTAAKWCCACHGTRRVCAWLRMARPNDTNLEIINHFQTFTRFLLRKQSNNICLFAHLNTCTPPRSHKNKQVLDPCQRPWLIEALFFSFFSWPCIFGSVSQDVPELATLRDNSGTGTCTTKAIIDMDVIFDHSRMLLFDVSQTL